MPKAVFIGGPFPVCQCAASEDDVLRSAAAFNPALLDSAFLIRLAPTIGEAYNEEASVWIVYKSSKGKKSKLFIKV